MQVQSDTRPYEVDLRKIFVDHEIFNFGSRGSFLSVGMKMGWRIVRN